MTEKSCFVIMPIGDQFYGDTTIKSDELRRRYDDLIKEAILRAMPTLEVTRADEVAIPGTITTDIITRIMHSDYVVADVTYPNPNVFYELGLRHACRPGTIIIKDKNGPKIPFDIAHLRFIEYENTPSGLKKLAESLGKYFSHLEANPEKPDNHFLELAKLTEYRFPDYAKPAESNPEEEAFMAFATSPELLNIMARKAKGEEIDQLEIMGTIMNNPSIAQPLLKHLIRSGSIQLNQSPKKGTGSRSKSSKKTRK